MNNPQAHIEIILTQRNKQLLREWQKKSHAQAMRYGGRELIVPQEQMLLDKISASNEQILISEPQLELVFTWMMNSVKNKYGSLTFVFPGEEQLFKLISNLAEIHLGQGVPSHPGNLMGLKDDEKSFSMELNSKFAVILVLTIAIALIGLLIFIESKEQNSRVIEKDSASPRDEFTNLPMRTRESLDSVYNANLQAIENIYQQQLKANPGLDGALKISLSINQHGTVQFYRDIKVTIVDYEFLENLHEQIETWNFGFVERPGIQVGIFDFDFN